MENLISENCYLIEKIAKGFIKLKKEGENSNVRSNIFNEWNN